MQIEIIAAIDQNGLIGLNGKIPWHIPEDLKRFKELTTGHAVIMGHNTWASLPASVRPLPDRLNIVLSRGFFNGSKGVLTGFDSVSPDLHAAIHLASDGNEKAFIIGGEQLYREALPLADRIYLTKIEQTIEVKEGDKAAYFPVADLNEIADWRVQREHRNGFIFERWDRVKK